MFTLHQIASRTTRDRKQRATLVRVLKMKTGYTPQGLGFVAGTTYSKYKVNSSGRLVINTDPQHYVSMITFIDKRLHCHVSCSCADTCFRWEVANSYKNAAEIEYSNGEAPDITNPHYNPGLCKHLMALYMKIKPKLPNG